MRYAAESDRVTVRLLTGDCRTVMETLPEASVHCCITSPPYWGLRSYLPSEHPDKPLEIGSEENIDEWVQTLVEVFRKVRRVLRDDGTLWVNCGDSYAPGTAGDRTTAQTGKHGYWGNPAVNKRIDGRSSGLKPKDLIGQPWRLAFALQADGWWLRQEIIWAKKNPMPESIRDRFTKAHEHVFLLSKSKNYYFDFDAVQEPVEGGAHARRAAYKTPDGWYTRSGDGGHGSFHAEGREKGEIIGEGVGHRQGPPGNPAPTPKAALATSGNDGSYADGKSSRMGRGAGWRKLAEPGSGTKNNTSFEAACAELVSTRNPRSVRHLASQPFRGAHFATYPPELIRPFVLAGCPPGGTILDPFGGSGTTGLVADREHRNAILIDLDSRNEGMAAARISDEAGLFTDIET